MDIGKIINEGLQKNRMSQKELAFKLGVKPPTINKWISGQNGTPSEKLIEIIEMLDLVEDFFPGYKKIDPEEEKENATLKDRMAKQEEDMQALREKVAKIDKAVDMLLPLATKNNTAEELIDGIWDKLE